MTPHDALMSELFKIKNYLEQYNDEFDPDGGDRAMMLLKECILACNDYVKNEPETKPERTRHG